MDPSRGNNADDATGIVSRYDADHVGPSKDSSSGNREQERNGSHPAKKYRLVQLKQASSGRMSGST